MRLLFLNLPQNR